MAPESETNRGPLSLPNALPDNSPQQTVTEPPEPEAGEKSKLGSRIFVGLACALAIGAVLFGVFVFYSSITSASKLGEMPAYPGAGPVKTPEETLNKVNAELKAINLKAQAELALSNDDLAKVQNFYTGAMRDKGFATGAIAPFAPGQLFAPLRSFGGARVVVFTKKELPNEFYLLIINTVTDRNMSSAAGELDGLQTKPGQSLIMLARVFQR